MILLTIPWTGAQSFAVAHKAAHGVEVLPPIAARFTVGIVSDASVERLLVVGLVAHETRAATATQTGLAGKGRSVAAANAGLLVQKEFGHFQFLGRLDVKARS